MADIEKELGEAERARRRQGQHGNTRSPKPPFTCKDQVRTFSPQDKGPSQSWLRAVGDAKRYLICTGKVFSPFWGLSFSLSWECLAFTRECWSPQNVPSGGLSGLRLASLSAHRRIRWVNTAQGAHDGNPFYARGPIQDPHQVCWWTAVYPFHNPELIVLDRMAVDGVFESHVLSCSSLSLATSGAPQGHTWRASTATGQA